MWCGTFYHDSRFEWKEQCNVVLGECLCRRMSKYGKSTCRGARVCVFVCCLHLFTWMFGSIKSSAAFSITQPMSQQQTHTMFQCCSGTIKQTINSLFTTCSNNLFFTFTHRPCSPCRNHENRYDVCVCYYINC